MNKSRMSVELAWVGDRHLRVSFGTAGSSETTARVFTAHERLGRAGIRGLLELTPAYVTLLATFDPGTLEPERAEAEVRGVLSELDSDPVRAPGGPVEIPVCYEGECAPDAREVAETLGLSAQEIVALHSAPEYTVAFIGFSPGFPYLLGLPARLAMDRLDSPRARVSAGSIGIAGEQTGIYPHSTPGGWRLIGRTPLRLFDAEKSSPALLHAGDRVRFVPIPLGRFRAMMRGSS